MTMSPSTQHTADVTDPLTGENTHLTAPTANKLEELIDEHLAQAYPFPTVSDEHHDDAVSD